MDILEAPSLSQQLFVLKTKHRALDEEINQLHSSLSADQLYLQRLKRQKLRIKENIGCIETLQIPDLDA